MMKIVCLKGQQAYKTRQICEMLNIGKSDSLVK